MTDIELTDWRGNTYTVGTKVIYAAMSGRSVELQEATVLAIEKKYKDSETYSWKILKPGQAVPHRRIWNRDQQDYVDSNEEVETKLSVKLQPNGKGSRNFSMRNDSIISWIDPEGNEHSHDEMEEILKAIHGPRSSWGGPTGYTYTQHWIPQDFGWERKETYVLPRPVTISIIDNITVV